MSGPHAVPKLGDIVLYHDVVRQDLWDPSAPVSWPAIVTSVLAPEPGHDMPAVRLTVFRPYERPLWDVTARFSAEAEARCWSWPETAG